MTREDAVLYLLAELTGLRKPNPGCKQAAMVALNEALYEVQKAEILSWVPVGPAPHDLAMLEHRAQVTASCVSALDDLERQHKAAKKEWHPGRAFELAEVSVGAVTMAQPS